MMEAKLAILGKEKEKLTGEILNLNNQLKELETKLLQGISLNNDQEAKVTSVVVVVFVAAGYCYCYFLFSTRNM